ncbi:MULTISPECIES: hypothetical protein [unclassified Saccharicrinis]|uniref:hypothetical protein n=1 Tax=unclassified Saccharicrinis TaxID=2646859 RepID=UPI003D32D251
MNSSTKVFITAVILLFGTSIYGQYGITYYSFHNLSFHTYLTKIKTNDLTGEIKIGTNREFEDITAELDCFLRFEEKEYHRFSVGMGFLIEPFTKYDSDFGFVFPGSVEVFPFQGFKKVSFLIEAAPLFYTDGETNLRSMIGVRYCFY